MSIPCYIVLTFPRHHNHAVPIKIIEVHMDLDSAIEKSETLNMNSNDSIYMVISSTLKTDNISTRLTQKDLKTGDIIFKVDLLGIHCITIIEPNLINNIGPYFTYINHSQNNSRNHSYHKDYNSLNTVLNNYHNLKTYNDYGLYKTYKEAKRAYMLCKNSSFKLYQE